MLLLAACTSGKDSVPAAGPDLPELAACDGTYDFTVDLEPNPSNPWWFVRTNSSDVFWAVVMLEGAAAGGCPTESVAGDTETFSGDCDAGGTSVKGSLSYTHAGDTSSAVLSALDAHGADGSLSGDGRFTWDYGDTTVSVVADGAYTFARGSEYDGSFSFADLHLERTATAFTGGGRIEAEWAYGHGAYCMTLALEKGDGAPTGYWAVQGLQTWMMVGDGGCPAIYLDGEPHGDACDVEWTLFE